MAENNPWVLKFPSPLKKRDYIHHYGREYQIIKFLRATDDTLEEEEGVIYRVRNILTNRIVNITLPYEIQPHPEEERVEDNFFQILQLNEDSNEVTLKSWLTGVERKTKVRWDEDVEIIRDGLMKEDEELYCTLKEVMMGKEVIGNYKFWPNNPPIMKMPDEIMDMIFSKVSPEDRLTCRLVTKKWASILPVNKFLKCMWLSVNPEGTSNPVRAIFHRLDIPNHPIPENDVRGRMCTIGISDERSEAEKILVYRSNHEIHMMDVRPLVIASMLEGVYNLIITFKSRIQHLLETLSQHCTKLKTFTFEDGAEDDEAAESNYTYAKKIIAANNGHLQSLHLTTSLRELDLASVIGGCTSLQDLKIKLSKRPSILQNLGSIQPSIIILSIGGFTVSKSQLLSITTNFPQLEYLDVEVPHNHSDNSPDDTDADEVDKDTVLQILHTLPSLKLVTLILGPPIQNGMDICMKACGLKNHGLAKFYYSLDLQRMYPNPESFECLTFEDRKLRRGGWYY